MIRRFAVALLGLALSGTTMLVSAADDPAAVVRNTAEQVLDSLRSDRARYQDDHALFQLVREVVFPRLDRERTAQWVLGANWRTATPAQREQFIAEFSDLLLRTYGTALRQYDSEKLNYLPAQAPAAPIGSPCAPRSSARTAPR